jgi:iron complex transport system permease protein
VYAHSIWKKILFLIVLAGILIIASAIIITLGAIPITIPEVYGVLINRFISGLYSFNIDPLIDHVVWQIRMPHIIGAIIVGFGLGVCGCVMQAVLKNPLASPFTLGISSGAQFGVSIAVVFDITILSGPYFLIGNAFLFALLCSGIILALSAMKGANPETMILVGIALNYFFQAMTEALHYVANDEQLRQMTEWGMGGFANLNWTSFMILTAVSIISVPLLYKNAWDLNLMTVGDESAKSMGVNANHIRIFVMVVASFLVASLVAFVGPIGFVGLIAPHVGRMIIGGDHRYLIPAAGMLGAVILLCADAISMTLISPIVIPLGTVMALLGVPFFLFLILKGKRREYWS